MKRNRIEKCMGDHHEKSGKLCEKDDDLLLLLLVGWLVTRPK